MNKFLSVLALSLSLSTGALASDFHIKLDKDRCTTDVKTAISAFHDAGYQGMFMFQDKIVPSQLHELVYENESMNVLAVTLTYKADDLSGDPAKLCIDFYGQKPDVKGPILKKFILRLGIDDFNKAHDEYMKKMNEERAKEHDPPISDPFAANYRK